MLKLFDITDMIINQDIDGIKIELTKTIDILSYFGKTDRVLRLLAKYD